MHDLPFVHFVHQVHIELADKVLLRLLAGVDTEGRGWRITCGNRESLRVTRHSLAEIGKLFAHQRKDALLQFLLKGLVGASGVELVESLLPDLTDDGKSAVARSASTPSPPPPELPHLVRGGALVVVGAAPVLG